MLISPENFGWAKDFLTFGATTFMDENIGNISLSIPEVCPVNSRVLCSSDNTVNGLAEGTVEGKSV